MTLLTATIDGEDLCHGGDPGDAVGYSYSGETTTRVCNADAENGYPVAGGLSWLNSAAVRADIDRDRVVLTVSIGDPRGAFAVEFRRTTDGRVLIHLPHPGETSPHLPTREIHPGTLEILESSGGKPAIFADDEIEGGDDD